MSAYDVGAELIMLGPSLVQLSMVTLPPPPDPWPVLPALCTSHSVGLQISALLVKPDLNQKYC